MACHGTRTYVRRQAQAPGDRPQSVAVQPRLLEPAREPRYDCGVRLRGLRLRLRPLNEDLRRSFEVKLDEREPHEQAGV